MKICESTDENIENSILANIRFNAVTKRYFAVCFFKFELLDSVNTHSLLRPNIIIIPTVPEINLAMDIVSNNL